jgi:hypothetical protein
MVGERDESVPVGLKVQSQANTQHAVIEVSEHDLEPLGSVQCHRIEHFEHGRPLETDIFWARVFELGLAARLIGAQQLFQQVDVDFFTHVVQAENPERPSNRGRFRCVRGPWRWRSDSSAGRCVLQGDLCFRNRDNDADWSMPVRALQPDSHYTDPSQRAVGADRPP